MAAGIACSALHSSHLSEDREEDNVDYNSWAGVHDFNQGEGEDGLIITDLDIFRSITVMMTTVKMIITLSMMLGLKKRNVSLSFHLLQMPSLDMTVPVIILSIATVMTSKTKNCN